VRAGPGRPLESISKIIDVAPTGNLWVSPKCRLKNSHGEFRSASVNFQFVCISILIQDICRGHAGGVERDTYLSVTRKQPEDTRFEPGSGSGSAGIKLCEKLFALKVRTVKVVPCEDITDCSLISTIRRGNLRGTASKISRGVLTLYVTRRFYSIFKETGLDVTDEQLGIFGHEAGEHTHGGP